MLARNTEHIDWSKYVAYDETSPSGLRALDGEPCGRRVETTVKELSYWVLDVGDTYYLCHRVVWEILRHRLESKEQVDHIDGEGLNNRIENLRVTDHKTNVRNKRKQYNNTSGTTGVYLNKKKDRKGNLTVYWVASWIDIDGKQRTKCFRAERDGAYEAACLHRAAMIEELNACGAGYTERHGT